MGKHARFFLGIILGSFIIVPVINSTAYLNEYGVSIWDGDYASETHVEICCSVHEGFLNLEKNGTGHVIAKSGVSIAMMDWLSYFMKFKWECTPMRESEPVVIRDNETNSNVFHVLYMMKHGRCLISPQPYIVTIARFQNYCDFLSPFVYTPFGLLIPVPQQVAMGGISSVWRPFDNLVWAALVISIAVTMFLSLFNWLYSRSKVVNNSDRNEVSLDLHWLFLFGLLMSKAGYSAPASFKMRLAGGAWCIAALILTNFYSSVLTSLITLSLPVPIVNSVEELANNDNVDLVIAKNWGASLLISGGIDTNPLMKKLDTKIKSSKDSICLNITECFRQVADKKTTTFLQDKPLLLALLSEDYRQTGRCNVALAKETYGMLYLAWAISKNYSNFETFQRGMLRMMATGLVGHWEDVYVPKPLKCLVDPSSRQAMLADIRNPTLVDLDGLVPAFEFLIIGVAVAALVLLGEWMKKFQLCRFLPT